MCAADPPATVVKDGETRLTGVDRPVREILAALARGEDPGLTPAQLELVEAAFERDPGLAG